MTTQIILFYLFDKLKKDMIYIKINCCFSRYNK